MEHMKNANIFIISFFLIIKNVSLYPVRVQSVTAVFEIMGCFPSFGLSITHSILVAFSEFPD